MFPLRFTSATGDAVTVTVDNQNESGGTTGGIDWRDRGDSGSGDSLVQLAEDFIKNNSGIVRVTLTDVPAGDYTVVSYHVDPSNDQSGEIKVLLDDDGTGFVDTGARGNSDFNIGGPNNLTNENINTTRASFSFTSDGTNPVIILFDGSTFPGDSETPLSGLEIFTAASSGESASSTLTVNVEGRNDVPVANADGNTITETGGTDTGEAAATSGNVLIGGGANPGDVADTDVDDDDITNSTTGIVDNSVVTVQTIDYVGTGTAFSGDVPTPTLVANGTAVDGQYGTLAINPDGSYSYELDDDAVDGLGASDVEQEIFNYTIWDGNETVETSNTAGFSFDGETLSPTDVPTGFTVSDITGAGVSLSPNFYASYPGRPVLQVTGGGTADLSTAISANDYFEFTITPPTNGEFDLNSISLNVARGGSSTNRGFAIMSDIKPFTDGNEIFKDDTVDSARSTFTNYSGDLSGAEYQGLTGPITFRIYKYTNNGGLSLEFDDIIVDGEFRFVEEVTVTSTLSITVMGTNDAPIGVDDDLSATLVVSEDEVTTVTPSTALVANDIDPDSSLSVKAETVSSSSGAIVILQSNGSFSYDPRGIASLQALAEGERVTDSFTYTVEDVEGETSTASVTLTVEGRGAIEIDTNLLMPGSFATSEPGGDGTADSVSVELVSGDLVINVNGETLRTVPSATFSTDRDLSIVGSADVDTITIGDLGSVIGNLTIAGNGGDDQVIFDSDLSVSGALAVTANAVSLSSNVTLTGKGSINGKFSGSTSSVIVTNGDLVIGDSSSGSGFSMNGSINIGSGDTLTLNDSGLSLLGSSTVVDGTLVAAGGVQIAGGEVISGSGTINGEVKTNTGTIAPGTGPNGIGSLTIEQLSFGTASTDGVFEVDITDVDTLDQLEVSGAIDLSDAELRITGTLASAVTAGTTEILLLNNTGDNSNQITGTFKDLPEGGAVTIDGEVFTISYVGGADSNDVVLTSAGTAETGVSLSGGDLLINDINVQSSDDKITISVVDDGMGNLFYQIEDPDLVLGTGIPSGSQPDEHTVRIPVGAVSGSIIINTEDGDDVLTVDFEGGGGAGLSNNIIYNGGGQDGDGDSLVIDDFDFTRFVHDHTNSTDGTLTVDGVRTIQYTGLEPVLVNNGTIDEAEFTLPAGDDNAELTDDGLGNLILRSTDPTPSFEMTSFVKPANSLVINGNAADTDVLTIASDIDLASADFTVNDAVVQLDGSTSADPHTIIADQVSFDQVNIAGGNTLELDVDSTNVSDIDSVEIADGILRLSDGSNVSVTNNITNGAGAGSLQVNEGILTVGTGLSVDTLQVGKNATSNSNLTVTTGAVTVGNGSELLVIGDRDSGIAPVTHHIATVDFSGASSVDISVGTATLGSITGNPSTEGRSHGILLLSDGNTNNFTANSVVVGSSPSRGNEANGGGENDSIVSEIQFGGATSNFNVDSLILGDRKAQGEITIDPNGTLNITGRTGAAADVTLGVNVNGGTSSNSLGRINASGATLNATIDTLQLGGRDGSGGSGRGVLNFEAGLVTVDTISLGNGTANSFGTINQDGGTIQFETLEKGSAAATAEYNWTAGTIQNVSGSDLTNTDVEITLVGAGQRIVSVDSGQTATFAAASNISGTTGGTLEKEGDGILVVDANTTYDVATSVDAGVLAGTGTIGGATTVTTNGDLAPGTAVGSLDTLTFSNGVTLDGGFNVDVDAAAAGSADVIAITGDLDIADATLNLSITGTLDDLRYEIATFTGGFTGNGTTGDFMTVTGLPVDYGVEIDGNSVFVSALNVAPVNSVPDTSVDPIVGEENRGIEMTGANAITISDVDAGTGDLVVTLTSVNGFFTVGNDTTGTGADVTGDGSNLLTITGTVAEINATLLDSEFQGDSNFTGSAQVTVKTDDQGNTGFDGSNTDGGKISKTDEDVIVFDIQPTNDDPVIGVPSAQSVVEDTALTFSSGIGNAITITDPDLADTPDSATNTVDGEFKVTLTVTHGTLTLTNTALTNEISSQTGNGTSILSFTARDATAALEGLVYQGLTHFNGSDLIDIRVDDQGNTGFGPGKDFNDVAITVTAAEDAPIIAGTPLADVTTDVGTEEDFTIDFSEFDLGEGHTVTIDWGDGTALETFNTGDQNRFDTTGNLNSIPPAADEHSLDVSHTFNTASPVGTPFEVTVTVEDAAGNSDIETFEVVANNVVPSNVNFSLTANVIEGGQVTINGGSFDDTGIEEHTVVVDWGDGTTTEVDLAAGITTFSGITHTYRDDNPTGTFLDSYDVKVKIRDENGAESSEALRSTTVFNADPTALAITSLTPSNNIEEGDTVTLAGTFTDVGIEDTHTVTIQWDDPNNPNSVFQLDAIEDLIANTSTFTSTGADTTSVLRITGVTAAGKVDFEVDHTYPDDGFNGGFNGSGQGTGTSADISRVSFTVSDDDASGDVTSAQSQINVRNVNPTTTATADNLTPDEGDTVQLFGNVTDPGLPTELLSFRWTLDSATNSGGDDILAVQNFTEATTEDASFVPVDDGTYVFTFTVNDDDGGSASRQVTITVANVAPTLGADVNVPLTETNASPSTPLTSNGTLNVSDPGEADVVTAEYDPNTGFAVTGVTNGLSVPVADLADFFTISPAQPIDGTATTGTINWDFDSDTETFDYLAANETITMTYTVIVTDDEGLSDSQNVTVTITGTNDVPVATDNDYTVLEDAGNTAIGNVITDDTGDGADSDLDTSDVLSVVSVDTTGTLGTVVVDSNGNFSYDPNGQFESLAAGETAEDTFEYTIDDGHTSGYWRMEQDLDAGGGFEVPNVIASGSALTGASGGVDFANIPAGTVSLTGNENTGSLDGGPNINGTIVSYGALNSDSITVEFDARTTEGSATLFSRTTGSNGLVIANPNDLQVTYYTSDGGGGAILNTLDTNVNLDATWRHLAFTYDAATGTANFLVDGSVMATNTTTAGRGMFWDTNAAISVGSGLDGGGVSSGSGAGLIDELKISSIARPSSDLLGASEANYTATVTVTITGTNDVPVATDNDYTVLEDAGNTAIGNVITDDTGDGADSDLDTSDVLSVVSVDTTGTLGTVVVDSNGNFSYDPNGQFESLAAGETAEDTFEYTIDDGHTSGYWRMEQDLDAGGGFEVPNVIASGSALTGASGGVDFANIPAGTVSLTGNENTGSLDGGPNINGTIVAYGALNSDSITVEFDARTTEGSATLFSRTTGSNGLVIANPNDLQVTYYTSDGGGGAILNTLDTNVNLDATWRHLAFTYDAATGTANFLVDGSVMATNTTTAGRGMFWDTNAAISVGSGLDGGGVSSGSGAGLIDELKISSIARPSSDLLGASEANYTATVTVTITGTNDVPVAVADTNFAIETGGVNNSDRPFGGDGATEAGTNGTVLANDFDVDGDDQVAPPNGSVEVTNIEYTGGGTPVDSNVGGSVAGDTVVDGQYGTLTIRPDGTYEYALNEQATDALNEGEIRDDVFTYSIANPDSGLRIDFGENNNNSPIEAGYQGYVAEHETDGTFTTQSFNAFGTQISVTPTWVTGAVNTAKQMIDRGGNDGSDTPDFLRDWIGTDNRGPVGDPLTLTLAGIPAGTYEWTSYHHDTEDQTGPFDVSLTDANGTNVTTGVDVTDGNSGVVALADVSRFVTTIVSNGTDPVSFVFDNTGNSGSTQFFVMNGFELVETSQAELTIEVRGSNDAPVAVADTAITDENTTATVDVLANDTDVDAADIPTNFSVDSVSLTGATNLTNALGTSVTPATVVITAGNEIQFNPGTDFDQLAVGEQSVVTIAYTMSDDEGLQASSTVEITVTGANDAPVANPDTNEITETGGTVTTENATITGNVLGGPGASAGDQTDTDPETNDIPDSNPHDGSVNVVNVEYTGADPAFQNTNAGGAVQAGGTSVDGQFGTLTINPDGTYTYALNDAAVDGLDTGDNPTEEFTYTISDGDIDPNAFVTGITGSTVVNETLVDLTVTDSNGNSHTLSVADIVDVTVNSFEGDNTLKEPVRLHLILMYCLKMIDLIRGFSIQQVMASNWSLLRQSVRPWFLNLTQPARMGMTVSWPEPVLTE